MKKTPSYGKRTNNMEYLKIQKLLLNVGLIFATFCIKNSSLCEINACYLTDNIVPKHYSIRLMPNMEMENKNFKGNLVVSFEIRQNTKNFTIDLLHLIINETETFVRDTSNKKYIPKEYHYHNIRQMLMFHFENVLLKGNYVLVTNFTSTSTEDIGFYTKSYMSHKGHQMVAVTQTKDFKARHIFPCWDEASLKATFDISIKHHKKYKVLSNMPEKQTIKAETNDTIWTEFKTTPIMSTHLVAAVVFDPVYIFNAFTSETINMWCRPHLVSQIDLEFVHNVTKDIIQHLINYTLFSDVPKINIVLLPDSLITQTVSSWALIIYRESDFIRKEEDIIGMRRRHIANLIAEHLARHWFGNLVTPTGWTWVWLRDGSIKFFKSYILNMIFKDWRSMDMLVVQDIHSALYYDISDMSAVINEKRLQFSELTNYEHISHVTSAKASALLRMLQFLITDDVFREGIVSYLQNYAYDSTGEHAIWLSVQFHFIESYFKSLAHNMHIDTFSKHTIFYNSKESSKTFKIKTVMDTYMKQNRYPLVLVERNYITGKTIISQECFSSQKINDMIWWIPLNFATQTEPDFFNTSFIWLSPTNKNITFNFQPNDWIIVNLQQYGYYRVNYDKTNWQRIVDYLNSDEYVKIHVLNRAQLIDDAYTLVRYEKIDVSIFMNLTKYLSRETDYIVWYTVFRILALSSEYFLLPESKNLKLHFSEILGSRLEKLGYEEDPNEHDFTKSERLNATYWACYLGNIKCRSVATSKLINYLDDPENYNILPHWQAWTYCAGLMAANLTIWNKLKDMYFKRPNQNFYEFLACAEEPTIIIYYLNIWQNLKNSILQSKNHDIIFHIIIKRHGRNDKILNYILTNFQTLVPNTSLRHSMINQVIMHMYSLAQLNKVENFVNNEFQILPNILAEIRDTIEIRRSNLEFLTHFFVKRFLSSEDKHLNFNVN